MKSINLFIRRSVSVGGLFMLLFAVNFNIAAQNFESSQLTSNTFVASCFINDNEGWLADNKAMLWHTINAGETWDSISIEKYFLKLDFTDALNGFALATNAAYKTSDGGHTWITLTLPGTIGNALYFLNNDIGLISGTQGSYRTTNGGTTWSTVSTDNASFTDYYFMNATVGIATANDDELYKSIWRTTDGGLTWSNVFNEPNYIMNAIWFNNENTGWAAGYYDQIGLGREPEIIHTTDGGLTWQSVYRNPAIVSKGESLMDIRFRNTLEGFAISNYSESVYTTDGGLTWNLIYENQIPGFPLPQGIYKSLDGNNEMYLSGKLGYVVKWK
ncbi:MAG: hypothetical protein LH473_06920 [Chitinophagales bacterium]|nr:hypothetical protein [Chitinophagales bacterium]